MNLPTHGRHRAWRAARVRAALVAVFGATFLAIALGAVAEAQSDAENSLRESEPANGATLGASPEALRFVFTEELDQDHRLVAPVTCGNPAQAQNLGVPVIDDDDEHIVTIDVLTPFPRGACAVSWQLRDELDQLITADLITFSVQNDPPAVSTDPPADSASAAPTTVVAPAGVAADSVDEEGSSGGALWLGRVLSTLGIFVVFGGLVLIGAAWPEGPEYVITVRFLRSMWILGLVGTLLFVVALTADATGRSFGASLAPSTWFDLADDVGWPGRAALARVVLVVASGWVVMRPERVIDPTTQLAAYAIPGLALVAVGLSRTGGDFAAIGVAMAIAHAIAVAVWLGGTVMVARVVLAGPGDDDLVQAVRGFNRLSGPAIVATVVTGVVQVIRLDGGSLFSSSHGRVMLLKTVAVAAMLFVSMTVRQMVHARLSRATEMTVPLADRFRRAFGAEAAVGVVVLALSGWLLALSPPRHDDTDSVRYAVTRPFTDTASGLDLDVSLTPSAVGLNGVRVRVNAPAQGISNLVVTFVPPEGVAAREIEQPIPLAGAGTAVLASDVGIPLDAAGTWTVQVSGATTTGTLTGASSSFPVTGGEVTTETQATAAETTGSTTTPEAIITILTDTDTTGG